MMLVNAHFEKPTEVKLDFTMSGNKTCLWSMRIATQITPNSSSFPLVQQINSFKQSYLCQSSRYGGQRKWSRCCFCKLDLAYQHLPPHLLLSAGLLSHPFPKMPTH